MIKVIKDMSVEGILFLSALISVSITFAILFILFKEALPFFEVVSLKDFFFDTHWAPTFYPARYGIAPLVVGTISTTIIACIFAVPSGYLVAILLSEYLSERLRSILKPVIELLAAIPSVVFGYFALLVVTPWLQGFYPELQGFNRLSAGIVMGFMILPYMASLSEDALKSVPQHLREASLALGSNRLETALKVVTPSAISGLSSASILTISRALGETMVVAIAAGEQVNNSWDPTQPAATITAFIVNISKGDLPHGSVGYQSIFAAGLVLSIITFGLNIFAHFIRKRFHKRYV